jgi:hypothetical protein
MTDDQMIVGRVRETAMHWAMQTAVTGEDAMAILARAQLYEDYILSEGAGLRNRVPKLK